MQPLTEDDPDQIGPYMLLSQLGAGGMGRVYLASSPGGRLTAVKVVRPELAEDQAFRARFHREVRACQAVSGAFTTSVVDADPEAPNPWLATTYVAGPSLHEAVVKHGRLDEEAVGTLAAGLAEALVAIHRAGLVHRDLKPGNVLLAEDGPRVIDFGISRAMDGTALTGTGVVMGSAGYMAPEQVASTRDVGPAGDVFALGATLVFALTGEGPFGSGSPAGVLYRVVNSQPRLDGVPAGLLPLVTACLEKDPAKRPTPGHLVGALGGARTWPPVALQAELQRRVREAAALAAAPPPDVPSNGSRSGYQADRAAPWPVAFPAVTGPPSRRRVLGLTAGVVGGVAGIAGIGAAVAWATGGDGTGHRGATGPGRGTGRSGGASPRAAGSVNPVGASAEPLPAWTFTAPGLAMRPDLLAIGDMIVVDTRSDGVYGVDAKSGSRRWFLPPRTPVGAWVVTASPGHFLAAGGTLYCSLDGGQEMEWMTVDQQSGHVHTIGTVSQGTERAGPIVGVSGSVVLFPQSTMVYPASTRIAAYDVRSKRRLWTRPHDGNSPVVAAADELGFYIAESSATGGSLVALDAQSGKVRWQSSLFGEPFTVGGTVVVFRRTTMPGAPARTELVGLSATDGRRKWNLATGDPAQAAVNATGIYVISGDYAVQAVEPDSGTVRWTAKGTGKGATDVSGNRMIAASDTLVAAAVSTPQSTGLRVFNPADGSRPWTYTLPGDTSTTLKFDVAGNVVCLLTGSGAGMSGFVG